MPQPELLLGVPGLQPSVWRVPVSSSVLELAFPSQVPCILLTNMNATFMPVGFNIVTEMTCHIHNMVCSSTKYFHDVDLFDSHPSPEVSTFSILILQMGNGGTEKAWPQRGLLSHCLLWTPITLSF